MPRPEHEHRTRVVEVVGGVDHRDPVGFEVAVHLAVAGKRFRHRHHREVAAEEAFRHIVAEHDPAHAGMQSVGADDEVEPPWRAVLERHIAVVGDGGDLVAEDVLDVVAAGVVVDLAEVVAHDLDVPVGHRADELEVVDPRRLGRPRPVHIQHRGAGGVFLDARQHTHPF